MNKWQTSPLGDLCDLINGRAFKPSEWGKTGLPIVRIQNLNDPTKPFNYYHGNYKETHFIKDGDILLSWSGTPGTSFGCFRWMRGPAILNQHIFKVTVNEDVIDSDFFIYAVDRKLDEMISQAHGAVGLRHITKKKLEAIHLPVPPLTEQRRIVARIKECMQRVGEIEKLRNESLLERDSLLESLIESEFDQLNGQTISLHDVCEIKSSLIDPRKKRYSDLLHVGGSNIVSKKGRLINLKTAREEQLKSGKFLFNDSMVLYNKIRPYLVKVARPNFSGLCSADMYPLSPKPKIMSRDFLFYMLFSRRFTQYAMAGSNRAGIPKINKKYLFAYEFKLPSIEDQERITHALDLAFAAIEELQYNMSVTEREVTFFRDVILRKAFSGEL